MQGLAMKAIPALPAARALALSVGFSIIAFLLGLAPPAMNPLALLVMTLFMNVLAVLLGDAILRLARLDVTPPLVLALAASTCFLGFFYIYSYQNEVENLPPRVVKGWDYNTRARTIREAEFQATGAYPSDVELLGRTGGEFDPRDRVLRIWTEDSVRQNETKLISVWLLLAVILSLSLLAVDHLAVPFVTTPRLLTGQVDGKKLAEVYRALLDAFNQASLAAMLRHRMDLRMDVVVPPRAAFATQVSELIDWAKREGRLDELIRCAIEEVPGNPRIKQLAARHGQEARLPSDDSDARRAG